MLAQKSPKTAHTVGMPAFYTHYLIAREVWKALPEEQQAPLRPYLGAYFFGAQGPDFCFFYKMLDPKKKNFGSFLHQRGGFPAFCVYKTFSAHSLRILAYALGFITHYAADVTFHPFVYAAAKKSLLKHSRIENAIDGYFKGTATSFDPYKAFFRPKLSKEEQSDLFVVYAAIAAKCGLPPLIKTSFLRAIQAFNAYMPMPNAFFGKEKDWGDTAIPDGQSARQKADVLLVRSIALACSLVEEFLLSLERRTPLSLEAFGKSFLSGN